MVDLVQVEQCDRNNLSLLLILLGMAFDQLHHFVEESVQDIVGFL